MVKVREKIKTCYLIELSNKSKIPIDEDELPKVIRGIKTGNTVVVRQGIFNPAFYVDIVKDVKRIQEIQEYNKSIQHQIKQGMAEPVELKPLDDIFDRVKEKLQLPEGK